MESAVALAQSIVEHPTLSEAFAQYEASQRLEVLRLQSAARNSLAWFEDIDRYLDFEPMQFCYSLLTRSQRISHENLRVRDADWLGQAETWFQDKTPASNEPARSPMLTPYRLRDMESRIESWSRRWRNTKRSTVHRVIGTWCTTASGPKVAQDWSLPR